MWVLLGSYELEEDFGGFQLHKDIFLGVFDSYETALLRRDKILNDGYDRLVIIDATMNRLVSETGVDWYN